MSYYYGYYYNDDDVYNKARGSAAYRQAVWGSLPHAIPAPRPSREQWHIFINQIHSASEHRFVKRMVNLVASILKDTQSRIKISKIVKAGSVGKNTQALGSDVDLVVYVNEDPVGAESVGRRLGECLIRSRRVRFTGNIKLHPNGRLQFQISEDGMLLDMEVLLGYDKVITSPKKMLDYRHNKDMAWRYMASVTVFQREFVMRHIGNNTEAKNAIRVGKFWRDKAALPDLKSYMIELLIVYIYNLNPATKSYEAFIQLLQLLADWTRLKPIVWEAYYKIADIPSGIRGERPLLMDPANPINNVAKNVAEQCPGLQEKAAAELRRQLK